MTGTTGGQPLTPWLFTTGTSSFMEFIERYDPDLMPGRGKRAAGAPGLTEDQIPHGTTVLALTYADGVMMAGDRRATMGNLIAQRDLEKVYPADEHTAVAFAGTVGLALDMVKLYQVELAHFEKVEGTAMTLDGKANRLATMIRNNLGQAMQGLTVVPMLAGYDLLAPEGKQGRIFSYDVTGGPYEMQDFHTVGSGSPYARGALKKLYRPGLSRREAALAALQALYDAADDDTATGGPDISRRIFPIVASITEEGYERMDEANTEELSRLVVEQRSRQPEGPTVAL
ncbi:proteasome subunit beta [Streptomyces sp. BRA346]|uniref:Proteasome subunit beta n=1 Tax=Streptomyces hygroscopicus TaxID=1912 RepID=V5RN21_STRHY|nr:EpnC [Streptomyces hygroscopicus]